MKRFDKKDLKIAGAACACVAVLAVAAALLIFSESNIDANLLSGAQGETHDELAPSVSSEPTPALTPPADDAQRAAPPTPADTPTPTPEQTPEPAYRLEHPPDREIDFASLAGQNADFIGWINIPGTDIDYPVLKSGDNAEYLTTDINGNPSSAGAIFMDMGNDAAFMDRLTVVYGHNMRDGSMFAGLHKFSDSDFFEQNRTIKLYTPEGMRIYEIISAYPIDDRNILYQTDYYDDDVWEAYVRGVYQRTGSNVNLHEMPVEGDDRILALSTCVSGAGEQRFLVQGVLIKYMGQ